MKLIFIGSIASVLTGAMLVGGVLVDPQFFFLVLPIGGLLIGAAVLESEE